MKKRIFLLAALLLAAAVLASCNDDDPAAPANGAPVISSLTADPATVEVAAASTVTCVATDPDGDALTYQWNCDAGTLAGTGNAVTWTAPAAAGAATVTCAVSDGDHNVSDSVDVTVFETVIPGTMVAVAGGSFSMGDAFAEGDAAEVPVHDVSLGAFTIGKYELTQGEWAQLMDPATYDVGAGATHPVYGVSWFAIIKYCNLRSLDEGLTPCYSIGGSTDPDAWPAMPAYSSDPSFAAWNAVTCDWSAGGYRLPTEAEWEYAARGGAAHADNFRYSGSQTVGNVAWYGDNAPDGVQPVGGKAPNQLGLHDMSGNLYEFCWDWFGPTYYTTCDGLGTVTDPAGPGAGDMRVVRGGGWGGAASNCRVAGRFRDYPVSHFSHTGVRLVRVP